MNDKRSTWDNSPQLREGVRADLSEWGGAVRGGMPWLGYPKKQPFVVEPERSLKSYDADKVDRMNKTMVAWRLGLNALHDGDELKLALNVLYALRLNFLNDRPAEANAKRMGVSVRTFWRRVDDGSFTFWRLHY